MKIRTHFISNSSSTSYLIYFKEKDLLAKCPTCGNCNALFFDLLEKVDDYGDTKIRHKDANTELKYLERSIEDTNEELAKLSKLPAQIYPYKWSNWTVAQTIKHRKEDLQQYQKQIKRIKEKIEQGYTIYDISISHHNQFIHESLKNLITTGKIGLIEKIEE